MSVRLRLTAIYTALFLAGAVVLIAINVGIVASTAYQPLSEAWLQEVIDRSKTDVPGQTPGDVNPDLARAVQVEHEIVRREQEVVVRRVVEESLTVLAVLALASVVAGWIVAGRFLRPVHEIARAAREASTTNLAHRVPVRGRGDELTELARTINDMLARLEAGVEEQRRFAANASHELRTPLTIMRTAIDVSLENPDASPDEMREAALEVRGGIDRAERLIDALLTLGRAGVVEVGDQRADLADAARAALAAGERSAAARRLRVSADLRPAPVRGNAVLLGRVVDNLVDNAVRHNVDGGAVEVATGSGHGGSWVAVRNDGPGLRGLSVPELLVPFRRAGTERTRDGGGFGLGLAIVSTVVGRHGGQLELEPNDRGGLDVTVRLP